MLTNDKINIYNSLLLERLSLFLNLRPDFITSNLINELTEECNLSTIDAFSLLLAEACGFDISNSVEDRELYESYFPYMIQQLHTEVYTNDPYYKEIKLPEQICGQWEFRTEQYHPYEAFVFRDMIEKEDGRLIPQIGFFDQKFSYPAVLESNREWMLITPNEIETMKQTIADATGNVLTYGLGLGYFAYMVSEKETVSSVTIVEKDKDVIQLFRTYILPQFHHSEKITLICEDAFCFAEKLKNINPYHYIFTDLWHDASDGVDLYLKMKTYEAPNSKCVYGYWIEKTLKLYID